MGLSIIEARRKELGKTRREIQEYAGICAKSYYLYAVSKKPKPIPSDKLIKIAEILECSTDYLLGIKNYTHITVADNKGAVIADIGQRDIVEHKNYKVILT